MLANARQGKYVAQTVLREKRWEMPLRRKKVRDNFGAALQGAKNKWVGNLQNGRSGG
jgi:hypothetical protein